MGALANHWPWLAGKINPIAVNRLVTVCRTRPHPWSTAHDYVSWTSLTDTSWSARHLPPVPEALTTPSAEELTGLFARPGDQVMSDKSTVLFPAFAQYLTDGFLRTRMPRKGEDENVRLRNTSNHQIDMCPLYGRNVEQTDALRLKSEARRERGRLKSQLVAGEEWAPFMYAGGHKKAEFEVLDDPLGLDPLATPALADRVFAFGGDRANATPHVAMLNTLFLREHNRLAGLIEAANPTWDDERVFQTARNTVIVVFIQIVVEEYINHISSEVYRLKAIPDVAWRAPWNRPNWMTTEFSLLYRWHSLIPDTITWDDKAYTIPDMLLNNEPLLNVGLAGAFVGISSQKAARLGAFNTAPALVPIEKQAIDQGRRVRLAPYTDYRKYMGMSQPERFEDISQDDRVVEFLGDVYERPQDVEFYVGLFAEDPGKNTPLPPLIRAMVAVDAFSQALTNPLLSEHVFNEPTFSPAGWAVIRAGSTLDAVVRRNTPDGAVDGRVTMTQPGWKRRR
ncbi:MAG: heme peroxidase [Actinomycetota bacterium]|nr:heme peroxidase [Actinomycetota bacterium]